MWSFAPSKDVGMTGIVDIFASHMFPFAIPVEIRCRGCCEPNTLQHKRWWRMHMRVMNLQLYAGIIYSFMREDILHPPSSTSYERFM